MAALEADKYLAALDLAHDNTATPKKIVNDPKGP
jgi:hypothetical protein